MHPLTPPMSSSFEHRRPDVVALPPISHFDMQVSAMHPLTPPDEVGHYQEQPRRTSESCVWDSSPSTIDWLDFTRNRSAHFIAEKTCEMICYLWFATDRQQSRRDSPTGSLSRDSSLVCGGRNGGVNPYPSPNHSPSSPAHSHIQLSPSSSPKRNPPPSTLQLVATASFVTFMQKLLETTQVSQSVIVLSLHYIHRLKERNRFTPAQRGSEYRIAVAGLMMANKFLDDNTYTNKTWSEVSGIELEEINRMEREFLMGVDFNLYVDKPTYESWLNLLKGLVIAKERDARSRAEGHRRRESRKVTNARSKAAEYQRQSNYSAQQTQRTYHHHPQAYVTPARLPPLSSAIPSSCYPRARSTSPTAAYGVRSSMVDSPADTYTSSVHGHPAMVHPSTHLRVDTTTQPNSQQQHPSSASSISSSNKRTAEAAFSPTSASFAAHLPNKRPSSMILQIPDSSYSTGMSSHDSAAAVPHSYSPLESLSSFARMSLAIGGVDCSPEKKHSSQAQHYPQQQHHHHQQEPVVPSTLVAPYSYSVENQRQQSQPRELYFYTLASSPMDAPTSRSRSRREERQGEQEEDIAMPHADGDAASYSDAGDATDEELEVNGQRVRTRKGKLMRWYNDGESQRAPAYSYAYDYSHAHSGYHHQASYNHGSSTSTSTSVSSRPQQHQQQYSPVQTAVTTTNVLPALVHPVPRPHMGVVQSASNSPSGIYVRNLGYPGSAYPVHQHRPAASSTRGAPPHQQSSHQQQSQQQQQPVSSWYSASYHPSPVQSKTYLAPLTQRDDRPTTTATYQHQYQHQHQQSTATLPSQHDAVWSKPPAVVRRLQEPVDDRSDGDECDVDRRMDSDSSAVPTAPFANAGPAGVHVAFGGDSPYRQYGYSTVGHQEQAQQQYSMGPGKHEQYARHYQHPQQHQQQQTTARYVATGEWDRGHPARY